MATRTTDALLDLLTRDSLFEARERLRTRDVQQATNLAGDEGNIGFMTNIIRGGRQIREGLAGAPAPVQEALELELFKKGVAEDAKTRGISLATSPEEFGKVVYEHAINQGRLPIAQEAVRFIFEARVRERELESLDRYRRGVVGQADEPSLTKPTNPTTVDINNVKRVLSQLPDTETLPQKQMDTMATDIAGREKDLRNANKTLTYEQSVKESLNYFSDRVIPGKKRELVGVDIFAPDIEAEYLLSPQAAAEAFLSNKINITRFNNLLQKYWSTWRPSKALEKRLREKAKQIQEAASMVEVGS